MNSRPTTSPSVPPHSVVRPHHVHIPAWAFLVLAALAVAPWIWFALRQPMARLDNPPPRPLPAAPAPPQLERRVGPWGEMESLEIILMPTEELIPAGWSEPRPVEWSFAGFTVERLAEWFRGLPLSATHRAELLDMSRWRATPETVIVPVSDEVVLDLDPAARIAINRVLARDERNASHSSPWSLRTNLWDVACQTAGISAESRRRLERLAYYGGHRLFISDVFAVLNQTTSREEKVRIVRLTSSASAHLLHLRIRPDSDLNALVLYWAGRGRRKDLRPIFEALKALPGGGTLDISHLLPAFARQRVFTYPHPAQSADGVRRDCHWTTLNFFSVTPDDRFGDSSFAQQYIIDHYYPVGEAPQFGDVIFFTRTDGSVVHSAVYLAADYVFTKNGDTVRQPWTIMELRDLRELYSILAPDGLRVQFWRNRDYEN
ncbi:MAG: hypothetical protein N2652_01630 [Kiritimatiellae bacterium]|nr:hypothetical protein [Kiritimatiellia bacterium]